MSICTKGLGVVRNLLHHITPVLEAVIAKITDITGKIKALEANPNVEAIVEMIPLGSEIEGYLNKGLDILTGVDNQVLTFAEKLKAWLDGFATVHEKNAGVFKLASISTKVADTVPDATKTESFYDSAVQLNIMSNKEAA